MLDSGMADGIQKKRREKRRGRVSRLRGGAKVGGAVASLRVALVLRF